MPAFRRCMLSQACMKTTHSQGAHPKRRNVIITSTALHGQTVSFLLTEWNFAAVGHKLEWVRREIAMKSRAVWYIRMRYEFRIRNTSRVYTTHFHRVKKSAKHGYSKYMHYKLQARMVRSHATWCQNCTLSTRNELVIYTLCLQSDMRVTRWE